MSLSAPAFSAAIWKARSQRFCVPSRFVDDEKGAIWMEYLFDWSSLSVHGRIFLCSAIFGGDTRERFKSTEMLWSDVTVGADPILVVN